MKCFQKPVPYVRTCVGIDGDEKLLGSEAGLEDGDGEDGRGAV